MSSFNEAVKYLSIRPARVASIQEMENAQNISGSTNSDKYLTIDSARPVQTIPVEITLAAYQQSYDAIPNYANRLLYQYNLTMPSPFYFIDPLILVTPGTDFYKLFYIAIKWRHGHIVTRRFVYGHNIEVQANINSPARYNNELIPVNCCFEVWTTFQTSVDPGARDFGLLVPLVLRTSLLYIPNTADELNVNEPANTIYDVVNHGVVLPLAQGFTINQPNVAFLDN